MEYIVATAAIAAVYVFIFGLLSSVLHIVFSGIRRLRGRPPRFRWIIAGRVVFIVAFFVIAVPLLFTTEDHVKQFSHWLYYGWEGLGAAVALSAMILPVSLPLIEAWRDRRTSSYVLSAAALLSFPLIVAYVAALTVSAMATLDLTPPDSPFVHMQNLSGEGDRAYFEWNDNTAPCGAWIAKTLDLPKLDRSKPGWSGTVDDFNTERLTFWFDSAARGVLFDSVEVYHCSFSAIAPNRDSLVMSTIVFLFQLFYPILFYAGLVVLFRAIFTRARKTIAEHTN